jgi:hypothetical protein
MGEFAVLADGRKFIPASLNEVYDGKNSNVYGSLFIDGLEIPLFPGPSLEDLVEMEKHSDLAHFKRIKENEMERIKNKFETNIDVSKLAEFRSRFEILYAILFEALPYFVSTPKVGQKQESRGVTLNESQVIKLLLDNVGLRRYRGYENQMKSIMNIGDVESIDRMLNEFSERKNPWTIFQDYLKVGSTLRTTRDNDNVQPTQNGDEKLAKILRDFQNPNARSVTKYSGSSGPVKDSKFFDLTGIPSGILGNYFLIDDDKIFRLLETSDVKGREIIKIDGKNFTRGQSFDKLILNSAVEESLRRKALEENRDSIVESLKKIKDEIRAKVEADSLSLSSLLLMFSEMESFEVGKFGFLRNTGGLENYTVYAHTGIYVLKDWKSNRRGLYKFPDCRIGVTITHSDVSSPFVLDLYKHPSLRGDMESGQGICLANAPLPGRTLSEKLYERIELAINVMQGGYTTNCTPNRSLSDPIFTEYRISSNDPGLRNGDYFITNEFVGD